MIDRLAAVAGVLLRAAFAVIMLVRRPRPIHSRGLVLRGELAWSAAAHSSGIRWIDDARAGTGADGAGTVPVAARLSRSVGLPFALPDVIGLALRVPAADGDADVEFASTGTGVPGRFLLAPRRAPTRAAFSTVIPYRTPAGPVLLGAQSATAEMLPTELGELAERLRSRPWRLRLFFASPTGLWHPFADLTLRTADDQDDSALRFDPVIRPLPGTTSYRWARLARQPSYRQAQGRPLPPPAARAHRGGDVPSDGDAPPVG